LKIQDSDVEDEGFESSEDELGDSNSFVDDEDDDENFI